MIWTILLFLVILSVLVLVHEWGHYIVAKKSGMKVEEFGLGFPPRAYAWEGKDGMKWTLNWVPIGGFVKVKGEGGEDREDDDSFASKPIWQRFAVLIAGVAMNMVAAFVLFTIAFSIGVPSIIEGDVDAAAVISDRSLYITQSLEGSPAAIAGLEEGDRVVSLDGQVFSDGPLARAYLQERNENTTITVGVEREGTVETVEVAPAYLEALDRMGLGVAIVETGTVRYPWYLAPIQGVETTVFYTGQILAAFADVVQSFFQGESQDAVELAGPVGIAVITGEIAQQGFVSVLQFAALLSINLAFINILPFPALDGGRLLFVAIEAVRRKPLNHAWETAIHNIGFLILIGIIILVTYNDILNLL